MQVQFNSIPKSEPTQPKFGLHVALATQPKPVEELDIEHLELVSGGASQQVDSPKTGW